MGAMGFIAISLLFFYSVFFNANTKSYVGWIVLVISAILGTILGLLLARVTKLGVAVLSAWGGICLGLILYSAFLYKFESQVVFWLFIVALAVIFGALSFVIYDHIIIISTTMIGSYAFVRGISLYAGGYPNEFTVAQMLQQGLY